MHPRLWLLGVAAGVAGGVVAGSSRAEAYEFDVRARTIGQGSQPRSFRLLSEDLLLQRSRFTQTLSLSIWDILGRQPRLELWSSRPPSGPKVYFTTYMRVDHDFGDYTAGSIDLGASDFDAVDLIPELAATSLGLDVLYAYAAVEGLGNGLVDLRIGRQMLVDSLDWFAMDGATVQVNTPWHLAVIGLGGLRVRDSSPLGSYVQEPDGTASSECQEYVEGAGWRPIDRPPTGSDNNPFESDFDLCPQREELMPTFGGAIETRDLPVQARVSYRRAVSRTPGLIGDANRQDPPDVGYYPNEAGEAPGWGVNEERIAGTIRAPFRFAAGRGQITPYAGARYSVLHGLIDESHAGVRFRHGAHSLEPELYYLFPTFDGDSIYNVFSSQPYLDLRMTYDVRMTDQLRAYVRGFARRFRVEDADEAFDDLEPTQLAGGGQIGGSYQHGPESSARLDAFYEDGQGGLRAGGMGSLRWRILPPLDIASRVSLIKFDDDALDDFDGTTFGVQAGATYLLHRGIALSVLAEENTNLFYDSQFRLIGVLDLAFNPDL